MQFKYIHHGFRCLSEEEVKETNSIARIFQHEKSGARLLSMTNEDDNKVFGIGFRTPPNDSTGVPHILEHCVLAGSRKYKSKEPFMDMYRSSLQTFLNAMTYPDKTIYPVASRNAQDFKNLMDVYLDAVFYPAIYQKKEIFLQEGWHYEILQPEDPITLKGVVYNEMKGAYSAPDTPLYFSVNKALFPDSPYGKESGGEPYTIPNLTYEAFLDFHRRYYHPSNAYLFLYGDGNLDEQLAYLDREYLSHFDKIDLDSSIPLQPGFSQPVNQSAAYSISSEENAQGKDYLAYCAVTGTSNGKENIIHELLTDVLINDQSAPLKNAILDLDICEDVQSLTTEGLQLAFGLACVNSDQSYQDLFVITVEETLKKIVKNGLDKKQLEASLNKIEYNLRECDNYPTKGIMYFINSFDTWLYDGDPLDSLRYESHLKEIRDSIATDYFETYIRERILNNPHKAIVTMIAQKGLNEEKDKKVATELAAYKETLSSHKLSSMIAENQALLAMQMKEDSQEAKDTIPKLSLDQVPTTITPIPEQAIKKDNYTLLLHPQFTSGIHYVDLVFDLTSLTEQEIPIFSLLCDSLGMMDTEHFDYKSLSTEMHLHTGGVNTSATVYQDDRIEDGYFPKLIVYSKCLPGQLEKMADLIEEVICRTKLTDKKRLKEIVQLLKSRYENSIFQNGNSVAAARLSSYYSQAAKYGELLSGLEYYFFLSNLEEAFAEKADGILTEMNRIYQKVIQKNKLILSITAEEESLLEVSQVLEKLIGKLPSQPIPANLPVFALRRDNEGILSSSNVQYVAKGYNFRKLGFPYRGQMEVLSNLLSKSYLYNNIRAIGGAYGASLSLGRKGNLIATSYRDPNLAKTLEIYDNIPDFLNSLVMDQKELNQYIIGCVGRFDPPMTPVTKGRTALSMYISGQTTQDIERDLQDALSTILPDLKAYGPMIKLVMEKNYLCVLGNSEIIKDYRQLFENLIKLKK